MVEITQELIDKLPDIRKTRLDAQIVSEVGDALECDVTEALSIYYGSRVARLIDSNVCGVCCLDAKYLAEEVLKEVQS